jgi:hypothetical protein
MVSNPMMTLEDARIIKKRVGGTRIGTSYSDDGQRE